MLTAFRLEELIWDPPHDAPTAEEYKSTLAVQRTTFVRSLLAGLSTPWEVRLIATSVPDAVEKGTITVSLLCQNDVYTLPALFSSLLPECRMTQYVHDAVLPWEPLAAVSLRRRMDVVCLDSLDGNATSGLGFGAGSASGTPPDAGIIVPRPIKGKYGELEPLCRFLLGLPHPVAIRLCVSPLTMSSAEHDFFFTQIVACERLAQTGIAPSSDPSRVFPTLQSAARDCQARLAGIQDELKASSACFRLEIAAPAGADAFTLNTIAEFLAGRIDGSSGFDLLPVPLTAGDGDNFAPLLSQRASALELASLLPIPWPLPGQHIPIPVRRWRQKFPPPEMPATGTHLGTCHRGSAQIMLDSDTRALHTLIVGATGAGKSSSMTSSVLSDIENNRGVCLIDMGSDMYPNILGRIPSRRADDVIIIDPTDIENPVGINILEYDTIDKRHYIAQQVVGMMQKLILDEHGGQYAHNFVGPMFFQHLRMNLLLVMSDPENPGTLLDFHALFQHPRFWRRWVPLRIPDPQLQRWVDQVLDHTDYTRLNSDGVSMGAYVGSKFEGFVFDPLLRNIFCQKRSTVDFFAAMNEGKIILVNLSKGELTEPNARFLGMVLMAKLQAAAMQRSRLAPHERRPFHIYVDEYHTMATQNFTSLVTEGRKFGVSLTLASQCVHQVDPSIIEAILGNVGTLVLFRLGLSDARIMEPRLAPDISLSDLVNLPNGTAYVSTVMNRRRMPPFTLVTIPVDTERSSEQTRELIRERSRARYAGRRGIVECELARSLEEPDTEEGAEVKERWSRG